MQKKSSPKMQRGSRCKNSKWQRAFCEPMKWMNGANISGMAKHFLSKDFAG